MRRSFFSPFFFLTVTVTREAFVFFFFLLGVEIGEHFSPFS